MHRDEAAAPDSAGRSVTARLRGLVASVFRRDRAEPAVAASPEPEAATPHAPPREPRTVGVLTLPLHTNYGGNIQAFALFEALKALGYRPVLVNRRHRPNPQVEAPTPPGEAGRRVKHYAAGRRDPHVAFIDTHLGPFTGQFLSSEELRQGIGDYRLHALIVGSDQVWRPRYAKSLLEDFFLGFAPDDGPLRISYAASFGADEWEYTPEETAAARRLLARFDAVSVRESGAVELCARELLAEARHVLDPTLLVPIYRYRDLSGTGGADPATPRLLAYVLDSAPNTRTIVGRIESALALDAFAPDGRRFGSAEEGGDTSIEAWLAAFDTASFVVTDSFHGVVFSILFNKPFVAVGNRGRGLARFTSILRQLGLSDRLVLNAARLDVAAMLRPIDWAPVNARLDALRAESFAFLRDALEAERRPVAPSPEPQPVPAASEDGGNPLGVLCSGCGACVSEAAGALRMDWNADGFLVPRATADRAVPAEAVRVCPFNPKPELAVADEDVLAQRFLAAAPHSNPRAGRYESGYVGYSRAHRATSSSGGVATYVLEQLLRRGEVDAVLVVGTDGAGGYRYQLVDDPAAVAAMSKTRYYPVTLEALFELIERQGGRVAVTGVACFAKAIRLKQFYHPELRERIPFVVGIVCGGLKSRHYTDYLAQSSGIAGSYFGPDYRVKTPESTALDYSFAATDPHGQRRSVRMRKLGDMWGTGLFKARACDFCSDVLTELADISLGDAWLPEYKSDGMGNSIVVTRTPLAEAIIRDGVASGELVLDETPIKRILQSQGGGVNHKQKALGFRKALAERAADTPIPALRPHLLQPVPRTQALVQLLRERTRARSLFVWRQTPNAAAFGRRMRSTLRNLRAATEAHQGIGDGSLPAPLARWRSGRACCDDLGGAVERARASD